MSDKTSLKDEEVQEKFKLRELELQTQFELKFLTKNFVDLRDNFETLTNKVNWMIALIVVQFAGGDISTLVAAAKALI